MNRKSEELKEKQISEVMASIENRVRHAYNQGYEQGLIASKQEPCEEMTREEAIKMLYGMKADNLNLADLYTKNKYDALEMAIKALEQEPKIGHWIETAEEYYKAVNEYGGGVNANTPYFVDDIACSECLAMYSVIDNETERFNHCPSCGAKMVDTQEGEE